jgi:hypothetical protein
MARAPGEPFRDRLAGLDPETLTAFVAAVYDARGWTVTDEGGDGETLVWPPGTERPRRLAVHAGDDPTVTLRDDDGDDATTLDAADLRRMVRYALDDGDWIRLCREFFECDPEAVVLSAQTAESTPTDTAGTDRGGTERQSAVDDGAETPRDDELREAPDTDAAAAAAAARTGGEEGDDDGTAATWSATRVVAAGLAVALVVAGIVAAGPALTSSSGSGGDGSALGDDNGTETESPSTVRPAAPPDVMDREGRPVAPGGGEEVSVPEPRPPGVGTGGVDNVSAMVAAHEAALSNRSYRLSVDHREYADGRPTGVVRERTVVESSTRYRSDVTWMGVVRQTPSAVGDASTYADGNGLYIRLSQEPGSTIITYADSDRDRFARRTVSYLRETVSGSDLRIVDAVRHDGTTWVWITVGRDDAVGSLLVDEDGLVHELHYEYTHRPSDGPPVHVEVTMRVTPANVTTTPPPWLDRR